jgi:hypothetical protein
LFADFNNDGNKDLFLTNGYGRDMINRDFVKFYANERLKFLRGETSERMFQMLQGIKSTPLQSFMFENKGDLQFRDCSNEWGFGAVGFSHGGVYADLDNDGDLDLAVNRMNDVAAIYKNNSSEQNKNGNYLKVAFKVPGANSNAIGARVEVHTTDGMIMQENYPVHGFQSSMQGPMHFGLPSSTIDSVVIRWPAGEVQTLKNDIKVNTTITIHDKKADPQFNLLTNYKTVFNPADVAIPYKHTEDDANDFKVQPLMPNMLSYSGPHVAKADLNKDGLEDIYLCGAKEQEGLLLLQQRNGGFVVSPQPAFATDALSEDADAVFFDADKDGDMDLYVVSGGYAFAENDVALKDRLYINDKGTFVKNKSALPDETISGSCVKPTDVDADGDTDLFIGGRVVPGRYPESPQSFLLLNDGTGKFSNVAPTYASVLQNIGMITDALWTDINKDGKPDLIVCGEWMKLYCFENVNGKLVDASEKYFPEILSGWWNKLEAADLDGDGDADIVAANWGTNSQLQVNDKQPACIYCDDFDKNGAVDPIICYYIQGKSYPMASRDEITDQIVSLRQRFPTYDSYSEATINEIFSAEQLQAAKKLEANFFETVWFENRNGVFIKHSLPVQANYAPVYAIGIDDYNRDGKPDLLLAGNIEQTRIKIGKIDANYGVLLIGDGKGNFSYVPQPVSGINVKGCVRSITPLISNKKEKLLLFTVNNQLPAIYRY